MSADVFDDFPSWALLPKRETNVASFLAKYPTYDGRGIKIGILDSGIDPGAPGLQKTSDGKVKIVEMTDGSGAGDVDTSTVVEAVNGEITGLSGRKLKIPSTWTNPTNTYHIGLKNAFELYSKQLKERICKEEKEKLWDPQHKQHQAEAARRLQEFNEKNQNSSQLSQEKKLEKEDLEAAVEVLNMLEKKHNNLGPVYDCIVFHDGKMWRACIDTSEKGDLQSCKLLGPYSETYEYATLTPSDMLNYTVNIHQNGDLLEIVSMSTSHGTHVASIAAAYFPDDPDKNGIAPGAQIVSIGIGDLRLNSMETGASLTRGFIKAIESKCDIINMSYGEPSNWAGGRVIDLIHDVVCKHGIIVVSSAGNNGPALGTVTTPPSMSASSIIGVGAYVSPDMMDAEYSLRDKVPAMGYTWTSRGPGLDGDLGVSVCAPGGAITSVPKWMLRGSQLMNGTSMSSPHAAGSIALLLSGMKAKNLPYSPFSVRRAIENTAQKVPSWDAFSMGHGLLQVDKAFEHLIQYTSSIERDLRFSVSHCMKKGIVLREAVKTKRPYNALISVEPIFLDSINADPEKKIEFQMNLKLISDVSWLSVPLHLNLMYSSRSFVVRVDPCGLPPGEHFTWIKAFDSECPEKGPVFVIPVTVIKPTTLDESMNWETKFQSCVLKPGKVVRQFFDVPAGATYAFFQIRSKDTMNDASIVVHAIQLRPQLSCRAHEYHKMFRLRPKEEYKCVIDVQERRVIEIAVGKWWANADSLEAEYSISFHGLKPDCRQITMQPADGIHRIEVSSLLKYEDMSPSATLKSYVMVLRPSDSKVSPLKTRDVIPDSRQVYEIVLTYNFSLSKSTEVTPVCSLLSELLYESEYESQMWMLYDCNKQLMAIGDAYPSKYSTKLDKGDYVIKLQVRHEQCSLLDKISDMPLLIQTKLPSSISLDLFEKHSQALIGGKKMNSASVSPGVTLPIYIPPLPSDKLPKISSPGHYLLGTMTFSKDDAVKKVNTYQLKYVITETPKKSSSSSKNSSEKDKEKKPEEEFEEALRDLKVSWIPKLPEPSSKEVFSGILAKDPGHVPALLARIQYLDQEKIRQDNLLQIISLADKVLGSICSVELLAYFGSKIDKKEASNHKVSEKQKSQVIEALTKKGLALCDYLTQQEKGDDQPAAAAAAAAEDTKNVSSGDGATEASNTISQKAAKEQLTAKYTIEDVDAVYCELQKWVDMSDTKVASFTERHAVVRRHYARALKLLLKQQEDKPVLETEKKCFELYKKLGWTHCAHFFERSLLVKYPLSYRLF